MLVGGLSRIDHSVNGSVLSVAILLPETNQERAVTCTNAQGGDSGASTHWGDHNGRTTAIQVLIYSIMCLYYCCVL